jgi:response regulator RpfG family c-di-GMP phosphodiesterase
VISATLGPDDILKLYSDYLKLNGFKTINFDNPYNALDYLEDNISNCSLVITDYKMNGMSGTDFIKKINEKKNENNNIKFVMISAFLKEDFIMDHGNKNIPVTKTRIDLILEKPIHLEKFKLSISKLLE